MSKYSEEFRERVRSFVRVGHSPVEACREFCGPALATVYLWLGYRPPHVAVRAPAERVSMDGVERRFRPSWELKRAVALRHVEDGERIADLAASTGYSQTVLYNWIRRYRSGGTEALMALDRKKRTAGKEPPEPDGAKGGPPADGRDLEREVTELRMELHVLKEAVGLLKKDHGVDLEDLSNIERFLVVDALRGVLVQLFFVVLVR